MIGKISQFTEHALSDASIGRIDSSLHNVSTLTGNNYRVSGKSPFEASTPYIESDSADLSQLKTDPHSIHSSALDVASQSGIIPARDLALVRSIFDNLKPKTRGGF